MGFLSLSVCVCVSVCIVYVYVCMYMRGVLPPLCVFSLLCVFSTSEQPSILHLGCTLFQCDFIIFDYFYKVLFPNQVHGFQKLETNHFFLKDLIFPSAIVHQPNLQLVVGYNPYFLYMLILLIKDSKNYTCVHRQTNRQTQNLTSTHETNL